MLIAGPINVTGLYVNIIAVGVSLKSDTIMCNKKGLSPKIAIFFNTRKVEVRNPFISMQPIVASHFI